MLSDLRDSGAIEADADVVMLIWPVREAESGLKTIGMAIDKNRQGPTGPIALTFDGSMQVWSQNYDSVESAALVAIRNRGYQ
jgi:replicative DNA helicase